MSQSSKLGCGLRAALAGIVLSGSVTLASAAEYEMVIAHLLPEDLQSNEVQPSLKHFESLVESATDGAIDVQIFASGQLGSEVEAGKATQAGRTVQGTVMSSGAMSSFFKNYQIITTPFLFPNYLVARAYFNGPWHADFMKGAVAESGLRYMGTFDDGGGFVAFTNNKRLIKTAEDIAGLRIRVEENPAHIVTMKAMGASATPLPWGEVQTALSTGLADGQFNAPGVNRAYKLWDVNDYTTMTGHVYNSSTFVISDKWFQKLPDEYKVIVADSAREAVNIGHGVAALQAVIGWQESCANFKACYSMPPAERNKLRDMARPAWRDWITGDFGVDGALVDALWAEVSRVAEEETARSVSQLVE